jgi:tetratricopeptide (TPR) repeat protein
MKNEHPVLIEDADQEPTDMRRIVLPAALLIVGVAAADAQLRPGPGMQNHRAADDANLCKNFSSDASIAACTRLIERNPRDAAAFNNRGLYHDRKGERDLALADLDQAIRLDPRQAVPYKNRGFIYCGRADSSRLTGDHGRSIVDYSRAISDLDQAIALEPNFEAAYNRRGHAWYWKTDQDHAAGGYDRAIADYDQALRLNPNDALALNGRGNAWFTKRDYDRAIGDYDQAIRLDPKFAIAYSNRGNAYREKKDYDRALADYGRGLSVNPQLVHAYQNRGVAYARKGDYDRAAVDYGQAIRFDPKNAELYNLQGYAYGRKGDYDRAIAGYDQAIQLNPKFTVAHNNRAMAYEGKGDHAGAVAAFDQVLAFEPANAFAKQGRDRAKAAADAGATKPDPPASAPVPVPAGPERRVALVIGNSSYRAAPFLPNPRRDAEAVANALRQTGFQNVDLAMDLDRDGMVKALRSFRDRADHADWALIYYAGHGIEIDHRNYLIPTDAKLGDDRDVKAETVSDEELLSTVGGAKLLRLVLLDACRNNPFKDQMHRTVATRGLDRGLAPPPESKPGTLIVYSAKDGEVAADDAGGANSPFAAAFLEEIKVPGREVRRLFDYVRDDVLDLTGNRQQPFTYGSLPGKKDFFFVAGK